VEKVKVGVIGTGGISDCHLEAYRQNPFAEIVALCDLNLERAKSKAIKYEAQATFQDYRELLELPIDAISICTWNNTHAEIAIAALNAGKHVLVEKPLCQTVEQALRVEEAVRRNGKILQVGFVRRYADNTKVIKQFIDNGDLGDIYYAKASGVRRLGNPGGWFSDKERSGGGPLIDLGVHMIDLCWYLMGRPKVKSVNGAVYHKLGNRSNIKHLSFYKAADYDADKNDIEDLATAFVRFENGATLAVDTSFTLHAKKDESSIKLFGDKGGAEIDPELLIVSEKYDTIVNLHPQIDFPGINFANVFQNEIDHFIECVRFGRTPISPVEDGVELMKILCAVYESSEQGSEIRFD